MDIADEIKFMLAEALREESRAIRDDPHTYQPWFGEGIGFRLTVTSWPMDKAPDAVIEALKLVAEEL